MPVYTVEHNGKVFDIEGPAGATPEQLQAAIAPQQNERMSAPSDIRSNATAATENTSGSVLNSALRQLGLAGRAAVNAVASPLTLGGNAIGKVTNAAMGREVFQPSTEALNKGLTAVGLPEPETGIERFTQDVARTAPAFAIPGGFIPQVAGNAMIGAADAPAGKELQGAMLGSAGAGVGHVLTSTLARGMPGVSREARQLMDTTNIQPTVGMAVPKLRAAEDFTTGIPLFGEVTKGAKRRAIEEFSNEAIQRAVPGMPKVKGTPFEQLDSANDYVSSIYHDVLPHVKPEATTVGLSVVGNTPPPPSAAAFKSGFDRAMDNSYLTDAQREVLQRVYNDRAGKISSYTGEQLKTLDAELGEKIRSYQRGAGTSELANSLQELQLGLRQGIEARLPPEQQGRLAGANKAYRELIALNDAASKSPELTVTPQRLTKALAARDKKPITRLQGPMAEFAREAETVIPNTPGARGFSPAGMTGGVLGAALASIFGKVPLLLTGGATGVVGATRPAQAALTGNLAIQRALRRQLASGREIAPALGAAIMNPTEE